MPGYIQTPQRIDPAPCSGRIQAAIHVKQDRILTIAIIGAGIAGAACAQELVQQGKQVVVFDKGRTAGGRMSSKRTAAGYIDLGAQYFTARSSAFRLQCQQWLANGVIAPWHARTAQYENGNLIASPDNTLRYIGIPSMQAPVQQLLAGKDLRSNCRIDSIHFDGSHWQLYSENKHQGSFPQLILALPQQQAAQLLAPHVAQQPLTETVLADLLFGDTALQPCHAVNIELSQAVSVPFDAVFVKNDAAVSWLARQASKSGRAGAEHWVIHFNTAFSQQYLEAQPEQIARLAATELQRILGQPIAVKEALCHRWRFAQQAPDFAVQGFIYQAGSGLGLCGDWLNGGRVENAFLSGMSLAAAVAV